jgi:hypothetical protein
VTEGWLQVIGDTHIDLDRNWILGIASHEAGKRSCDTSRLRRRMARGSGRRLFLALRGSGRGLGLFLGRRHGLSRGFGDFFGAGVLVARDETHARVLAPVLVSRPKR